MSFLAFDMAVLPMGSFSVQITVRSRDTSLKPILFDVIHLLWRWTVLDAVTLDQLRTFIANAVFRPKEISAPQQARHGAAWAAGRQGASARHHPDSFFAPSAILRPS